jgi:predicted MFS family arabinose efflux permease
VERVVEHMADRTNQSLEHRLGGVTRKRVVLTLAGVLALNGANGGAVGAMAAQLEPAFHIGNTALGLLVTGSSLVGATASIPLGMLADRTSRTRLIALGIGFWVIAVMASGFAGSYLMLLLTQLAVGAMAAVAGPTVASLIGDLFAPAERGRIYAFILTGELVGAGFGIVVAGDVGAAISWRAGFFLLALPGIALLWALHRYLPEPARGGQARLSVGADHLVTAEDIADGKVAPKTVEEIDCDVVDTTVAERVAEQGIEPDEENVLRSDPASLGLGRAVRYILGIRTNILLIVASSVGYFFFAGVRTFAVLFITRRFALPQAVATLMVPLVGAGAIVGIWLGGKVSDRLLGHGRIDVVGAYIGGRG